MSIHEQITALLDGELVDAGAVDELLHVLAVSPEKRALLVEQVAMKRRFAASASSVVPPARADLAIMQGLAAIDAGYPAAGPGGGATSVATPLTLAGIGYAWRNILLGAMAVLLVAGAFGAGYLLRGEPETIAASTRTSPDAPAQASTLASAKTSAQASALASARDSIALRQTLLSDAKRVAGAAASEGVTASAIERPSGAALSSATRDSRVAARVTQSMRRTATSKRGALADASAEESTTVDAGDGSRSSGAASHGDRSDYLIPSHLRTPDTRTLASSAAAPSRVRATEAAAGEPYASLLSVRDDRLGLQAGFRSYARLSMPRVYGLAGPGTILLDQEVLGSYELGGEDDGLLARIRAGVAFGQTQFSQVFHSNTGGAAIDTVYEQTPQPFYARAFVAPELVRFDGVTGLFEVGGGYSEAGGFGTVGLNVEWRPIEEIALHAGASTWLFWSRFNGAVNLSTNLNAHLGAMIGF